jgi:aryl-alcohol dehydrogenase-like predicted oxidoreductase
MTMKKRSLGQTGLQVSVLGFGAMHINDERTSEIEAGQLLNQVLDAGINLIDTARGYGLSEERIGRHIAHRRSEYVLSTKVGYGIPGFDDWTYDCIVAGVEAACQRMRTDVIDIVHLHSCPLHVLQQGDVVRALEDCQASGKLRVAAYSGDNAELRWAIDSGHFGSVQASISMVDQFNLAQHLPQAQARQIGVIAKRPLAGAVWRFSERPGDYAEGQYWDRFRAMGMDPQGLEWGDLALRFSAFAPGVASAIVGTNKPENLQRNLDIVNRGTLDTSTESLIMQTFAARADNWNSII